MVKSVGFFEMLVVDAKGSTGGICVMWKTGVSLHQNEFNKTRSRSRYLMLFAIGF